MKFAKSLRVKLSILYLLTIVVPLVIIVFAMPGYYENVITQNSQTLTAATLDSLSHNIDLYLGDLDNLTLAPYLNDEVMSALKLKASPTYASASASQQLAANRALYSTFLRILSNTRGDLLSTIVLPVDGSVFVAAKNNPSSPVPNYPFTQQAWYKTALAANGDVVFVNPHPQDYLLTPISTQVFSVTRLIKDPDTQRPLAVIMADADSSVLQDIVSGIRLHVSSIIAIVGSNERLLYSSQPLSTPVVQAIARREPIIQDAKDTYIPVIKSTGLAHWSVVVLLSQSEIEAQLRWMYIAAGLFAIGGLCVTLLLFFVLSRWIIIPFQQLMQAMKSVQEGNLQTRFIVKGEDEIALLGNAFNTMIMRLNEMIEREYVMTLNQRNNAIIHGIEPADHPCQLRVCATAGKTGEEEKAVFSILIEDDGLGFATQIRGAGRGLGLANVRDRLKMAYEEASLTISSEVGIGTRVAIEIPQN
jgi:two-component system sensor histidine kinase YesM